MGRGPQAEAQTSKNAAKKAQVLMAVFYRPSWRGGRGESGSQPWHGMSGRDLASGTVMGEIHGDSTDTKEI